MKKLSKRKTIANIVKKAAAQFLAEEARRPRDLIADNTFELPDHFRHLPSTGKLPKGFTHVIGNIYRKPQIKIQPVEAKPLSHNEDVKRAIQAYTKPLENKTVAQSSAEAEIALSNLAMLARNGNGEALWQFARLVCDCTEGLNQMVRISPEAMEPFAKYRARWPMMRSTHPLNCDDDGLLEKIGLGKSAGVQLDKHSKWKPDYAANVAGALVGHIQAIRRQNPYCTKEKQKVYFADFLRPFSKESAPHWWFIAQKFLFASYPKDKLHEISELNAIVTSPSKRKSDSKISKAIREKIKERFFHLACQS